MIDESTNNLDLERLAQGFVRQENFRWSRPDRAARMANMGSEDEDLWGEVMSEFIACSPISDRLLPLILRLYNFERLGVFGEGYLQPWVEKASHERLEWLADLVRADVRARKAISGVSVPVAERRDSSLWALIM